MKKFLFLCLLVLSSLTVFSQGETEKVIEPPSQFDSSQVRLAISFPAKYHFDIISAMKQSGSMSGEVMNYIKNVWEQMDTAYTNTAIDRVISVEVSAGLVLSTFSLMGEQLNKYSAEANAQIKAALLPQIISNNWLLKRLQYETMRNESVIAERRRGSFDLLKKANQ